MLLSLSIALLVGAICAAIAAILKLQGPLLYALFPLAAMIPVLLSAARHSDSGKGSDNKAPAPATPVPANAQDDEREQGEVKWFSADKGFGFIIRENGDEIFVHYRSINGSGRRYLNDGQLVSYRVTQSSKGPQAEEVEPLSGGET